MKNQPFVALFALLTLMLGSLSASAQNQNQTNLVQWEKAISDSLCPWQPQACQDKDSNYVLMWWSYSIARQLPVGYCIAKYSKKGKHLSTDTLKGSYGNVVKIFPDTATGNFIVVFNWGVNCFNSNFSQEVWHRYHMWDTAYSQYYIYSCDVTPDGKYIIGGSYDGYDSNQRGMSFLQKLDASGSVIWCKKLRLSNSTYSPWIYVHPVSNNKFCAFVEDTFNPFRYRMVMFSDSAVVKWQKTFNYYFSSPCFNKKTNQFVTSAGDTSGVYLMVLDTSGTVISKRTGYDHVWGLIALQNSKDSGYAGIRWAGWDSDSSWIVNFVRFNKPMGKKSEIPIKINLRSNSPNCTGGSWEVFEDMDGNPILFGFSGDCDTALAVNLVKLTRDTFQYVKVISPNGGEVYNIGDSVTVKFQQSLVPSNARLIIAICDTCAMCAAWSILDTVNVIGDSYTFKLKDPGRYGKRFKFLVSVSDNKYLNLYDLSDSLFTITCDEKDSIKSAGGYVVTDTTSHTSIVVLTDTVFNKGSLYMVTDSMRVTKKTIREVSIIKYGLNIVGHCNRKTYLDSNYVLYDTSLTVLWDTIHFRSTDTLQKNLPGLGLAVKIAIYPNPNNGNFKIGVPTLEIGNTYNLTLVNAEGKVVHTQSVSSGITTITVNAKPGTYSLILQNKYRTLSTKLVIY